MVNRQPLPTSALTLARLVLALSLVVPLRASQEAPTAKPRWTGPDGLALPFQSDDEALDFLDRATVVSQEEIPVGTTDPKKLLLEKDGVRAHAVFRYVSVFKERVHLGDGSFVMRLRDSYLNEVAAYQLARLLGMDNVPPTVQRTLKRGGTGSVQLWIENAMLATERREQDLGLETPQEKRRLYDMHVFDNLINNIDRNLTNILVTEDGELWMIDHTRAFARDKDLPAPHRIRHVSRSLWNKLREVNEADVKACLKPYMGIFEIEGLLSRRNAIVALLEEKISEKGEDAVLFSYDDLTGELEPTEVPAENRVRE